MRIEEQHPDVMQNLEFVVAGAFHENPEMTDYAALHVYEALVELYSAEKAGRPPRLAPLNDFEKGILADLQEMCEWRLGRARPFAADQDQIEPLPLETLILCLKRLVKSVNTWTRRSGRQGYLNFMAPFSLHGGA
jgi:hypothetical protein